jgi:hypothetical protein
VTSSPTRSARSYLTTRGCGTISAGRCLPAERASGAAPPASSSSGGHELTLRPGRGPLNRECRALPQGLAAAVIGRGVRFTRWEEEPLCPSVSCSMSPAGVVRRPRCPALTATSLPVRTRSMRLSRSARVANALDDERPFESANASLAQWTRRTRHASADVACATRALRPSAWRRRDRSCSSPSPVVCRGVEVSGWDYRTCCDLLFVVDAFSYATPRRARRRRRAH